MVVQLDITGFIESLRKNQYPLKRTLELVAENIIEIKSEEDEENDD